MTAIGNSAAHATINQVGLMTNVSIDDLEQISASGTSEAQVAVVIQSIMEIDEQIGENLKRIDDLQKVRDAHAQRSADLSKWLAWGEKNNTNDDNKMGKHESVEWMPEFLKQNPDIAARYQMDLAEQVEYTYYKVGVKGSYQRCRTEDLPKIEAELAAKSLMPGYKPRIIKGHTKVETDWDKNAANIFGNGGLLAKHYYSVGDGKLETRTKGDIGLDKGGLLSHKDIQNAKDDHDESVRKLDSKIKSLNGRNEQLLQRKQRLLAVIGNMQRSNHQGQQASTQAR
jgi:hypothetical protein